MNVRSSSSNRSNLINLPQPSLPLSVADKVALKAAAHHLNPVVIVGDAGLTPAVLKEMAVAIKAHSLIKVRVAGDDRENRREVLESITTELECASVQIIGKILVLYKPKPVAKAKEYLPKKYAAVGLTKRPAPKKPSRAREDDSNQEPRNRFEPVYFEEPTRPGRAPRLASKDKERQ